MRQTLNTWMTESAKEVLRGDSGERRFRNGENGVFFCFFPLGSQIFPSGFKGIWGWKFPNQEFVNDFLRWLCFSSAGQGKSVLSLSKRTETEISGFSAFCGFNVPCVCFKIIIFCMAAILAMLRQVQALRLPKIVDRRTRRSDFDEFKLMKWWSPSWELSINFLS